MKKYNYCLKIEFVFSHIRIRIEYEFLLLGLTLQFVLRRLLRLTCGLSVVCGTMDVSNLLITIFLCCNCWYF